MEFVDSSPKAKELIEDYKADERMPHCKEPHEPKYPIAYLSVGKSITWFNDDKKWNAVRQFVFQWNKKNAESGKKLKAIRHPEHKLIELARIA